MVSKQIEMTINKDCKYQYEGSFRVKDYPNFILNKKNQLVKFKESIVHTNLRSKEIKCITNGVAVVNDDTETVPTVMTLPIGTCIWGRLDKKTKIIVNEKLTGLGGGY